MGYTLKQRLWNLFNFTNSHYKIRSYSAVEREWGDWWLPMNVSWNCVYSGMSRVCGDRGLGRVWRVDWLWLGELSVTLERKGAAGDRVGLTVESNVIVSAEASWLPLERNATFWIIFGLLFCPLSPQNISQTWLDRSLLGSQWESRELFRHPSIPPFFVLFSQYYVSADSVPGAAWGAENPVWGKHRFFPRRALRLADRCELRGS